jgi:cardiolipin synthase A/B
MIATWLPIWLLVVEALIRVAFMITVILRRRPVGVSLAWLVLLLLVPVLSTVLYILVGENRLGSRRIRRYEQLAAGIEHQAVRLWKHRCYESESAEREFGHIARYGTAISGFPPLGRNSLTLLADNQTMLEALIADIDSAKSHVHLLFYIFETDTAGAAVADALIRAAARGVQCRLLVDGVGSWGFIDSDLHERLLEAKVQVVEALAVNWFRRPLSRLDLRNHRKIAVIDGLTAYTGSQNITDLEFRASRWRETGPWIDASVRVRGPAAQALAVIFLKDWQLDSYEDLAPRVEEFLPDAPALDDAESVVQVIPSGPGPSPQAIHQAFLTIIYSAREELMMTTPYFVPDESLLNALTAAAARGVRVTIVMPKVSDSLLVASASRSHYLDLLEAGVHIYHYVPGLLHSKVLTVDRTIGLIGSTNFDARSFFLNFEVTLLVYDRDFAAALRFMQQGYTRQSESVTLADWRKRGWWLTLRDNTTQLLGPLL